MKLPKYIDNNKTKLIGLLTILIGLWLIIYFIPELLDSLLNTFLGNIILLLTAILISTRNYKYGILIAIIFLIFKRYSYVSSHKEGFTWTDKSTDDFLKIQNSINHNIIFDTETIQQWQASQEEVDYFNEHGIWPWTKETIKLYEEAYEKNPYIRNVAKDGTNYARTIYNQAAILQILAMQQKEGQFLLNGILVNDPSAQEEVEEDSGSGSYGYNSGLINQSETKDIIRCKNDNSGLERISYANNGPSIYGERPKIITDIDSNQLESIIPGFTFLNDKPCNPCMALNQPPDYSCPFSLKLKEQNSKVSKVWKYLWNLHP